ncbi:MULTISPECIES: Nif3-like dinuclear metal center hexameric protein [Candidatus Rhabdochlamydia]|uniref:Nif3-like dinuclear metal center hexameric protein n=1 Tax=Candidatus Rhabdochlamydia TaxID=292833 RepID=UPI003312F975
MTLQDLLQYLNQLLQPELFSDVCPNGLQIEGKKTISRVAFAVSASLATIKQAIALKADALIVHHGIFWDKTSCILLGSKKQKFQLLLENEISLLAYHLPLDAHQTVGNNWKAARDLNLTDLKAFGSLCGNKIGVKAQIKPTLVESFQTKLEAYYEHVAHTSLGGKKQISSVAIVSGGAHWMIEQAIQEEVDCFITGSFDEPIWDLAYENGIHFFALGHFSTEKVGVKCLKQITTKHFAIPAHFINLFNPF